MRILQYLCYKFKLIAYFLISTLISILMAFVSQENIINYVVDMTLIYTVFLFIIRVYDDISDYEKDKEKNNKKQYLKKNELKLLYVFISLVWISLNIIKFKLIGLFSIVFIAYVILQNKIEFFKIFLLSILSIYYFVSYSNYMILNNTKVVLYLFISQILAICYYYLKRRKG